MGITTIQYLEADIIKVKKDITVNLNHHPSNREVLEVLKQLSEEHNSPLKVIDMRTKYNPLVIEVDLS
ncbi:hypothetical protein [Pedobacter cryoconitis]|uniref:hypothetical protein n=1 Tax=Pedobacter cryoconitis TaxID=188932 RepID=UPI00160C15C1|nr:hypothetical protein [Pedobacter cryoconitis]MBB5643945.1 EAL domain-containing protein (putative c-di-GMP-specific phosphodiesterase class I) [Pedobacter cryoconitis]